LGGYNTYIEKKIETDPKITPYSNRLDQVIFLLEISGSEYDKIKYKA